VIETFEGFDFVVAPSGSCAGMLKKHYPGLFKNDPAWHRRAVEFSGRVHELVSFLADVRSVKAVSASLPAKVTYHDSCSGLRELGVQRQPRALLQSVSGLELSEMKGADVCCGFGGTFCVKYPDISNSIVSDKTAAIRESGADMLLAGDLGCLMNMAGKLKREQSPVKVRHVAEVLAGMLDAPAIGEKG
jgi:L-lactate dehydrogenase complex protein LldE